MDNKTKAAVTGGAVAGVLSVIPVLGSCCCLWAIGGGVLAVYLYLKEARTPMTPSDGAMLGAIAGGVAALVSLVIGIPVALAFGAAAMTDALRQARVEIPFSGMALLIVSTIIRAVVIAVLSVLGGVIGAAIFGKNAPGGMPPTPPPSNYGGTQPPMNTTGGGGYHSTFGTGS